MSTNKICINLKSFDHRLLDRATKEIMGSLSRTGVEVSGPIPMPRKIKRYTLNRSPHVNKKSREQFEIRRQFRLIVIHHPTPQIVDVLGKISLPAGVELKLVMN